MAIMIVTNINQEDMNINICHMIKKYQKVLQKDKKYHMVSFFWDIVTAVIIKKDHIHVIIGYFLLQSITLSLLIHCS